MNMDLFGGEEGSASDARVPPELAARLAMDGLPVTQGPVHVVVPAVPVPEPMGQPQPIDGPGNPSEASTEPQCYAHSLPSLERVREVLVQHGVLAQDDEAALHAGLVPAVAQLMAEAQAAPAGLPQAADVLCWVVDSELRRLAPMRVIRALAPFAVANGETMYPLCAPARRRETAEK